jgi:hypothetical protein
MRKGSFLGAATVAVALTACLAATEPARAQDWCVTHEHGGTSCGFASWQQCQSSGRGFCSPNPQGGQASSRDRRLR